MVIRNLSTQAVLAHRVEVARSVWRRLVGWLSRSAVSDGEALILPRCRSIHTCFMRFPLDVLFLKTVQGSRLKVEGDRRERSSLEPGAVNLEPVIRGEVVKALQAVGPFRVVWVVGADAVVELPAGTIAKTGAKAGELLEIA